MLTYDYAITNKRVIAKSGLIKRDVMEIRLGKVESVDVKQSILGRIFGYGDVVLTGTGSPLVLNFIGKPRSVKNEIDELLDNE